MCLNKGMLAANTSTQYHHMCYTNHCEVKQPPVARARTQFSTHTDLPLQTTAATHSGIVLTPRAPVVPMRRGQPRRVTGAMPKLPCRGWDCHTCSPKPRPSDHQCGVRRVSPAPPLAVVSAQAQDGDSPRHICNVLCYCASPTKAQTLNKS